MKKLLGGITLLGVLIPAAALAAGTDELWEVTSRTEMKGMPMQIPPSTMRICVPKGQVNDPERSQAGNQQETRCKVTDVKRSGNKTSWKMHCEAPNTMNGSGEMTYGGDHYHQVVKTVTDMGGQTMEMTQVMDGKRVGTCQAK